VGTLPEFAAQFCVRDSWPGFLNWPDLKFGTFGWSEAAATFSRLTSLLYVSQVTVW
jgi:hypothetical protein